MIQDDWLLLTLILIYEAKIAVGLDGFADVRSSSWIFRWQQNARTVGKDSCCDIVTDRHMGL